MRLAAIDIGSNAARLLISDVIKTSATDIDTVKLSLVRVPLRLGFDVFDTGTISEEKTDKLIKTLQSYQLLMDVYQVDHYISVATSAMRDAVNAKEVLAHAEKVTGIKIKVITGEEEASYIYENHIAENLNKEEAYLYIDVGGGSTELSFFSDGKLKAKESFNIGTIRMIKNQVQEEHWSAMKKFIKDKVIGARHITAIGSGGNINKVFSLSKRKEGKPLSLELLRNYYREFSSLSVSERISLYHFREDRADVIVPALLIYINVMRWADAEEIFVPKIGLADGLIHILYDQLRSKASAGAV